MTISGPTTSDGGTPPIRWLARATQALAVALLLYLPFEALLLELVPGNLYWPARLLPDASIALLTGVALVLDRGMPRVPRWLLIGLIVGSLIYLVADLARGFAPADTVNALRVVLRYVPLGILLLRFSPVLPWLSATLFWTLTASGLLQVLAGIVEVAVRTGWSRVGDVAPFFLVEGGTGRYDRFGMVMVALTLLVLARTGPGIGPALPRWGYALAGVALVMLFLSTSRQGMLALCVAAAVVALLPGWPRQRRLAAAGLAALALGMAVVVPQPVLLGTGDPNDPETDVTSRGQMALSLNPNRNFRLYLAVVLAPWAIAQEPLLGFGPGEHDTTSPDPRLSRFVRDSGMSWARARRFTNDSNYASLAIQFGLPLLLAYLAGLVAALRVVVRRAIAGHRLAVFALAYGVAVLVAANLGPAFETRTTSVILWTFLLAACADPPAPPA